MSNEDSTTFLYHGLIDGSLPTDLTHIRVGPSVTVIPQETFKGCFNLQEVELPEGLQEIERAAFKSCRSLKRINFPSTLKIIHDEAFFCCCELREIMLPEGLAVLGRKAFMCCSSLAKINLPSTITVVSEEAFHLCFKLSTVELPEGIEEIGQCAFDGCSSLMQINFPSTICVIWKFAFQACVNLEEVDLPECLQELGKGSFRACKSLRRISIPSTLKVLPDGCFEDCNGLIDLNLPHGLESIGQNAFSGTKIRSLLIPPRVGKIASSTFYYCNTIFSLELPDNLNEIEYNVYGRSPLKSLRNIAFPQTCLGVENFFDFRAMDDLGKAFQSVDRYGIVEALKHRFDGLEIHKMCYYHSYHPEETVLEDLMDIMNSTSKQQTMDTGRQQDCLGMTPLHILACSTRHHLNLYQLIIGKYPDNLIKVDKWGDNPLLYIFWNTAPSEVVQLFVNRYKSLFPDHVIDWDSIIETLAWANVPSDCLRTLVKTQRTAFPDQNINWQGILTRCANVPSGAFQLLLRFGISKRLSSLHVTRWQTEMEKHLDITMKQYLDREENIRIAYSKLVFYEQLKENIALLELALWKKEIKESTTREIDGSIPEDKEYCQACFGRLGNCVYRSLSLFGTFPSNQRENAWADTSVSRDQCRSNCGAEIVMPNVVCFLD